VPQIAQDSRLKTILSSGAKDAAALQQQLGVSQPTLSRIIQRNRHQVVTLGKARATLYALTRPMAELGHSIPIYQVQPSGDVRKYGTLSALANRQYYWQPTEERGQLYNHLPWFIENLRPEGFLGRAFARRCQALNLPDRLNDWSDQHLLLALALGGSDMPGNLIVGETALAAYLGNQGEPTISMKSIDRETRYPQLADEAMAGDPPGSSAGGEQPKFCIRIDNEAPHQVLVKFTPPVHTIEGQRWADLLVCEHLALQTITEAGHPAAQSQLFFFGTRAFLEVQRFDRIGNIGRKGITHLGILEDEFSGESRDRWHLSALRLNSAELITTDDVEDICWLEAFGRLIANTDRHFGNISFFTDALPFRLCPAYDMLPMHYRPATSGELIDRPYDLPTPDAKLFPYWADATLWAIKFWSNVTSDPRVSVGFQNIAQQQLEQLTEKNTTGPRLLS